MKIALIAPPYPLEEAPSPPLGISYVAAACEKAGAQVRIFDYIVRQYSPEKLEAEIKDFDPDVVGTTSVTMNYKKAAEILCLAKKIKPSLITLFGGPHVSFDIENTLTNYPGTDIVVIGEAEQTLAELIPVLCLRDQWKTINGIAFRENGEIIRTHERPLMENLDYLPLPARHLLPMSRYQALGFPVSIITSRGCPNKCIFCLGRKMVGFKVRYRTTQSVVDEIENILAYGIDIINIADDLFTADKTRVREFCGELKKRGLRFQWSAFARVNTVDLDTLKVMKDAGCHAVSFGIESGNTEMLKRVRKGITLDQARDAATACKEAGIIAHASFLAGLPGESIETLKDSDRFSKELDILYGYHFLAPFPGTTVREHAQDYDIEILSDDWDLYDADHVIVRTSHLEPQEIKDFVEKATSKVKTDWDDLDRRFKENKTNETEYLQIAGYYRMLMIYKVLSEDLIEKNAIQTGDFDQALTSLSRIIADQSHLEMDFTRHQIKDLIQKTYIRFEDKQGKIRFFWSHNNKSSEFSSQKKSGSLN
ncbi:MAG: B12-binding domain-containing radical SAM protein [Proteobacteria bacterium]|nr:B12-binding domain-containing radical SAM protein [Pseudomonadota bacterium]